MLVGFPLTAAAQASKSAAIAKELVQVLDAKKLDSIAAKTPAGEGNYAAALYFPNVQLLVVSGRYSAPQLMEPRLAGKQYRDTYMELSGTVAPDSKIFVQDMGEPGLSPKKQENMYDTWTQAGKMRKNSQSTKDFLDGDGGLTIHSSRRRFSFGCKQAQR